ncbi:hypothetical protein HK098_001477 [Nowakowskiella sp. JEL0407]|nr:hypothetical protein HK098_001477 [Nowakowskiella sp. JEL0407]
MSPTLNVLNQHLSAIQNLLDKFNIGVNAASVYRGIVSQWNFEMTKWKGYVGYFPPSVIEFIKASPLVQLVEIDAPMKLDGLRPTASILSGTGYNGTQGFDISKVTKQSEATWGLDRISRRNSTRTRTYVYPSSAGADVDIYIVDTGVYLDHPEFEKRAIWGAYFNSNGSVATPPPGGDDEGHGTHVAGIAAGKTYGVAKKSRIIAVKVLDKNGYGLVSTIALGIQWAINNTMTTNRRSVINLSLGGERADAKQDSILGRTVQFGTEKGIVFAAAAGNEGIDACNFSPGNLPSLITVGALNELDQRANFSNYGSCVSLYAPGTLITSSLPVTSTSVSKEPIGSGNGTSQACPHVSGVMALILSERKNATTAEVYAALFEAATYGALQASSLQDGDPNLIAYVGFDGVSGNSSIVDIKPSANQNSGTNLPDFNELQSYDFWMIVAYVIRFVWA